MPNTVLHDVAKRATSGPFFAWRHELAFPKSRVRYTYIPKNGCSSFKLSLGIAEGWLAVGDDPHSIAMARRLEGKMRTRGAQVRFVVLRDPLGRLVSAYLDRFSKEWDESTDQLVRQGLVADEASLHELSFEDFVRLVGRQRPSKMDPHWRRQSDFLRGEYTHYVDFARIGEGFRILESLGVEVYEHRPHATSAYRPLGAVAHQVPARELRRLRVEEGRVPTPQELVSPTIRDLAAEIYAQDYALIESVDFV